LDRLQSQRGLLEFLISCLCHPFIYIDMNYIIVT
jgi:hypothetical protein